MTKKVSKYILERDEIGHRAFVEIRHRTLDRGTTLCKGQNDKEEAQNNQDLKCTIEMNAGGKLVKIKEERRLLQD